MRNGNEFDAVFAGSVAAILAGIIGGAVIAVGSEAVRATTAGGAAALGALFAAVAATPLVIGRVLGVNSFRRVATGYAFSLVATVVVISLTYIYVPFVQTIPTLIAASAVAGIRFSQFVD